MNKLFVASLCLLCTLTNAYAQGGVQGSFIPPTPASLPTNPVVSTVLTDSPAPVSLRAVPEAISLADLRAYLKELKRETKEEKKRSGKESPQFARLKERIKLLNKYKGGITVVKGMLKLIPESGATLADFAFYSDLDELPPVEGEEDRALVVRAEMLVLYKRSPRFRIRFESEWFQKAKNVHNRSGFMMTNPERNPPMHMFAASAWHEVMGHYALSLRKGHWPQTKAEAFESEIFARVVQNKKLTEFFKKGKIPFEWYEREFTWNNKVISGLTKLLREEKGELEMALCEPF